MRQLAGVLAELHRRGSPIATSSPENLYLWRGEPAVGDFALVELPDAESLTAPGRVPGAFGYISDEMMVDPEVADGVPADVFALAKVLWVLLTPGALFPLQGRHRADGGPGSLQRTLALSNADGLDRRLEAATRPHHPRPARPTGTPVGRPPGRR